MTINCFTVLNRNIQKAPLTACSSIYWNLRTVSRGYKISRLEHALQSASRAWRDGAGEEMTVAALLHDIGDVLAP